MSKEYNKTESELKHKVLQSIPNILWHAKINEKGEFCDTYVSESVNHFLDLPQGTIGNDWDKYFEYIHPDDLLGVKSLIQSKLQGDGDYSITYRLITSSGNEKSVYSNGSVRYNQEAGYTEIYGVTTDLTEIKKKDRALEKNKQRYKALFNILPLPVVIHSFEKIKFVNSAAMDFAGAQVEHEIIEHSLLDFVYEDDKQKVLRKIYSAMNEELAVDIHENRFVRLDGQIRHVEVKGMPFIDTDGEKVLMVAFNDITDRVQAKKELEESESRYKTLFDIAPFPILVHSDNRIILYNKAVLKYIGTDNDALIKSKSILDFVHPDSRENVKARVEQLLKTDEVPPVVYEQFIDVNGRLLDMEVAASTFIYKNKKAVLVVLNDVTERNKDRKKLEELIATKDRFFSIIAHDLKNPFHQILGFSELLIDNEDEYDIEQVRKIVRYMFKSAQKGYALLTNLLDWARAQTGRISYNPQNIDIKQLIYDELDFIKQASQRKNIETAIELNEDVAGVYADKEMLKTVIRNLLSNAVKFTFPGGKILISVKYATVNLIEISVQDNGIGITAEQIDKIFRIDESTSTPGTDNESGTGLGLILCKEFTEKNGGEITVSGTPGKGSTFTVTVPVSTSLN